MAGWNENTIMQLRQRSVEELLKSRKTCVRDLKFFRWVLRPYALVLLIAGLACVLCRLDLGGLGLMMGVAAILLVAQRDVATRLWFIDLVLAERNQT